MGTWCLVTAAVIIEIEGLNAALKKAEVKAAEKKAASEKAVAELETVKTAGEKHEARVAELQVEPKDAVMKCEAL